MADLPRLRFPGGALGGADLRNAFLRDANLGGVYFSSDTKLTGAVVNGARVERYQLERLDDYGGLTVGDLMDMEIEDGVFTLRTAYSGFMQWIHLVALAVFLFPYVWFVVSQWSKARFVSAAGGLLQEPGGHMPLWEALFNFIYNGGIDWQLGRRMHWSFLLFVLMLLYNVLRAILLVKTKSLESHQQASGLRANFSLATARVQLKGLRWVRWFHLYKLAQ